MLKEQRIPDEDLEYSHPATETIPFIDVAGWFLHRWYVFAVTIPVVMALMLGGTLVAPNTYTSRAITYTSPGGPDSRFMAELFRSVGTSTINAYVGDNAPQLVRVTAASPGEAQRRVEQAIDVVSAMLIDDRPDYKGALDAAQARYDVLIDSGDNALALLALQEVGRAEVAYQAGLEPPLRIVQAASLPSQANPKMTIQKIIPALFVAVVMSLGIVLAFRFGGMIRSVRR